MKKTIIKLWLFIILCACFCLIILLIKPSKSYSYSYPEDGCKGRNQFIYHKIMDHQSYSILFLGTSHTLNAIIDSIINNETNEQSINLGLCGLGKNKEYMILKDWINLHHSLPKRVIIECNHWENTYSYGNFGYMADSKDVLEGLFLFNKSMHTDLYNALKIRIDYLFNNKKYQYYDNEDKEKYGYLQNPMQLNEDIAQQKKASRKIKWEQEKNNVFSKLEFSYPNFYIKKIAQLCKNNHIELCFVYLPSYGWPTLNPLHKNYLEKYAPVITLNNALDENINLWADDEHHNLLGAQKISLELGEYLKTKY